MVNWIGLGRAMSRLSASTCVEFHQATNQTFDPDMPIVSGDLAIAGAVCHVAVLAVALSTNVRINKQIARWSVQNPPDDRAPIRSRWIRFHMSALVFRFQGWPAKSLPVF